MKSLEAAPTAGKNSWINYQLQLMEMRRCNNNCVFYDEIRKRESGTIGECKLFGFIVREDDSCHDERKANKEEERIKKESSNGG